jgi:hypothetical protein
LYIQFPPITAFTAVISVNASITLSSSVNTLVLVNASSTAVTVTLPSRPAAGLAITVVKIDSSANAVTVTGSIETVSSKSLTSQYQKLSLIFDQTVWLDMGSGLV